MCLTPLTPSNTHGKIQNKLSDEFIILYRKKYKVKKCKRFLEFFSLVLVTTVLTKKIP